MVIIYVGDLKMKLEMNSIFDSIKFNDFVQLIPQSSNFKGIDSLHYCFKQEGSLILKVYLNQNANFINWGLYVQTSLDEYELIHEEIEFIREHGRVSVFDIEKRLKEITKDINKTINEYDFNSFFGG